MKTRILIIDDDRTVRESIKKSLVQSPDITQSIHLSQKKADLFGCDDGDAGKSYAVADEDFEVILADSGERGVELVKDSIENGRPFQLIFLDIRMPGMSGDECGQQIRLLDSKVGICFITGYSDKNALELVNKVGGAVDRILFLKKPFDYDEIGQIARAFTAKWFAERDSNAVLKSLKKLINGILELKDILLKDLQQLLNSILLQVLEFIGSENGFIARIDDSGELIFETGAGCFDSQEKISGVELSEILKGSLKAGKIYSISKKNKDVAIPIAAMGHDRLIVAVESSKITPRSRCVMKVFTKNASIALANTLIYQDLKRQKKKLEEKVEQQGYELVETAKRLGKVTDRDLLTGLFNRVYLEKYLFDQVETYVNSSTDTTTVLMHVDSCQEVRTIYGDEGRDTILTALALLLTECFSSDDVSGRWGGRRTDDIFLVVMSGSKKEKADQLLGKVQDLFQALPIINKFDQVKLGLTSVVVTFADEPNICSGSDILKTIEGMLLKIKGT